MPSIDRRAALLFVLAACKAGAKDAPSSNEPPPTKPPPALDAAAAPDAAARLKVPHGTIAGKPFAPNLIALLENSDGGKLGLYQMPADRLAARKRCDEPMGSSSEAEMTLYRPIPDWTTSVPVEVELGDWAATGVDGSARTPGKARIKLTEKDAATFRIAGQLELQSQDGSWSLVGPFEGDYCPTKVVTRDDGKLPPLAGVAWTRERVDPDTLPSTPVAAIIAGAPAPIAHVQYRTMTVNDGGEHRRPRLIFFTQSPPDPCSPMPEFEGADYRSDYMHVTLAADPVAGARLAGRNQPGGIDEGQDVTDVWEYAQEPDGTRAWFYSQYYSSSVAIDSIDDREVKGRVYIAVPDAGRSMIVGAFTAVRCPPID